MEIRLYVDICVVSFVPLPPFKLKYGQHQPVRRECFPFDTRIFFILNLCIQSYLTVFDILHFLSLLVVRSRTLLQVQEEYSEELPDATQFNLNSSDYLRAASPLPLQNMPSLGEVTVEVSDIERKSQENKMKTQKR